MPTTSPRWSMTDQTTSPRWSMTDGSAVLLDDNQAPPFSLTQSPLVAARRARHRQAGWSVFALFMAVLIGFGMLCVLTEHPASAQVAPVDPDPISSNSIPVPQVPTNTTIASNTTGPVGPKGPTGPSKAATGDATASLNLDLGSALTKPSQSLLIIILVTVLSVAPALLIMMTSFTRIIIVLGVTKNALGVNGIPPNQVMVGLALFLSLFIMGPTFNQMNKDGIQPYLAGKLDQKQAFNATTGPLKTFMLKQTRQEELALFVQASGKPRPALPADVSLTALIPAFILSELKTAMIMGFVVYIPFLVIDIIVSSSLMSMGMMMLPPQMISLPFKLLLFVLVDGWGLVVRSLLTSFH